MAPVGKEGADAAGSSQQMHYDMEDLMEQANEVQESMSRTYGVPDEVDEADLEAGERVSLGHVSMARELTRLPP